MQGKAPPATICEVAILADMVTLDEPGFICNIDIKVASITSNLPV